MGGLNRKPESRSILQPEMNKSFGIVGLIVSLFGFFLFGKLGFFGSGDLSILDASRMFMVGIGSFLSFIASLWLIANWKAPAIYHSKDMTANLGTLRILARIGFLAAAALVFFSVKLTLLLAVLNLTTSFFMTIFLVYDILGRK